MENPFQIFTSPIFGNVRAALIDGEPWFVGKVVAAALGYKDTKYAVKAHVAKEDKRGWRIPTQYGLKMAIAINESGLYSLVLASCLPQAQEFKRWVTSEVLPSIRKTGSYELLERQALPVVTVPAPARKTPSEMACAYVFDMSDDTGDYDRVRLAIDLINVSPENCKERLTHAAANLLFGRQIF